jgi:hypothetical protein
MVLVDDENIKFGLKLFWDIVTFLDLNILIILETLNMNATLHIEFWSFYFVNCPGAKGLYLAFNTGKCSSPLNTPL